MTAERLASLPPSSTQEQGSASAPLISVVVPVYNTEAYLRRCLDSITAQTYRNLEIIIINDGSSDRSCVIAEEYAKNDHRVCLVHQENAGVSEARNVGLSLSHGSYVSFIDSDDFIDPDYYETLFRIMSGNNADVAICNKRLIDDSTNHPFPYPPPLGISLLPASEALTELVDDSWLRNYLFDKLFTRELFYGIKFPTNRIFEDMAVMHEIIHRANIIVTTDEVKYNYTLRKDSLSSTKTIVTQYHRFLAHTERVVFFEKMHRGDLVLKETLLALHTAMNISPLTVFRALTHQEKEHLRTINTWTAQCRDKLSELPYESAYEARKVRRYIYSHTLFTVGCVLRDVYIRVKCNVKVLLRFGNARTTPRWERCNQGHTRF